MSIPLERGEDMRIIRGSELDFIPASHEDQQRPGVLKRVLATRNDLLDGRVQMINWASLPAGSSFRAHYHEDMEEVFIILRGRVRVVVDERTDELNAGDAIFVAPHEVHKMTNLTQDAADYIVMGISQGKGGQTVVVEQDN
jgi:mannose-6-phosphate isomerase-like protein (cupin superfamily)